MFRAVLDQAAALPGGDPLSNASPAANDPPAGTAPPPVAIPLHLLGAPRGGGVRTAADEEAGARASPASPPRRRRAPPRARPTVRDVVPLPGQSIDEALEEAELRYIEDFPEEFQDDERAPAAVDAPRPERAAPRSEADADGAAPPAAEPLAGASPPRRRRRQAVPPLAPAAAPPPPTGGAAPRVEDEDRERVPLGPRAARLAAAERRTRELEGRAAASAPSRGVERGVGMYQSRLLGDRRDAAKFDRPPDERAAPPPAARADGAPEPGWDRPLNPRQVARIQKRRRDLDVLRSVGRLPAWLDPREGRRRAAKPKTESRQRHASSRPRKKGAFMTQAQLDAEGYARDPATGLWSKRGPAARADATTRPS